MEQFSDTKELLELMMQPAFLVESGTICYVNQAAAKLLICPGTPVADVLFTGGEEYPAFHDGCLYLALRIDTQTYGASVTRINGLDVFCLELGNGSPELQALALAARSLRDPLASLMVSINRLLPTLDSQEEDTMQQTAHINQSLHQLLRLIGNMSDASRYVENTSYRYTNRDICAIVQDIFDKASTLSEQTGISLHFENLPEVVICMVDEEKLERAIYNLISNAMKFTPSGGTIYAKLTRHKNRLHLTVEDSGSGIPASLRSSIFVRYLRQPGMEDNHQGIGLGMVMVRSAATAHGGTVLVDQPRGTGTRITMTLAIRKQSGASLRSPRLKVDYTGEHDHCLTELAEVLPLDVYRHQ